MSVVGQSLSEPGFSEVDRRYIFEDRKLLNLLRKLAENSSVEEAMVERRINRQCEAVFEVQEEVFGPDPAYSLDDFTQDTVEITLGRMKQ